MLKKILARLSPPALLLAICGLAYGLQALWLGYYLDDWIILLAYQTGGAERLLQYTFLDARPLVFWIWWAAFKLLGVAPLGWHLWVLAWRWLAALAAYAVLRQLWPGRARQALWVALLFAIYPLFLQSSVALTYSFHWVCFTFFLLSLWLMILAARHPRQYALLSALAVLLNTLQLFSQEYFVGLELLRPLALYLALDEPGKGRRLRRAAVQWAPYLLLFAGYLAWRLAWMPTPGSDRNHPEMLFMLFSAPLQAIPRLGSMALQDLAEGLVGVWYRSLEASTFALSPLSNWMAWAVAAAAALLTLGYFLWQRRSAPEPAVAPGPPHQQAWTLAFSALALLGGFLPGWLTGRSISSTAGLYNDRFGLAAMWGAAILLVALLEAIVRPGRLQRVILCLLVGLGVGQQFRATATYRWSWEEQTRLFWQLKWRAPGLQTPTVFYGSGALVRYLGSWVNTAALNLAYEPTQRTTHMHYWYRDLYSADIQPQVEESQDVQDARKFISFQSGADQGVVLAYNLVDGQCAWLVDEDDRHNPYLPEQVLAALPLSNLSRILPDQVASLPETIFGPEPPASWCTYYEKADLALQMGDYNQVMALWDAAAQADLHPRSEPEYVPFIFGAAHTGRWELAVELTRKAFFPDYVMHDYLCSSWRRIRDETLATAEGQLALAEVSDALQCSSILNP